MIMIRGYSRNRPIMNKGKYTGKMIYRTPPDGCKPLTEPSYTICAAGPLTLWFIPEAQQ